MSEYTDIVDNVAGLAKDLPKDYRKAISFFNNLDFSDHVFRDTKTILVFYRQFSGGGIENVSRNLLKVWKSLGYKVHFVFEVEPNLNNAEEDIGAGYSLLPRTVSESYEVRAKAWAKIIERENPCLIIYNAWLDSLLPWDLLMNKGLRVAFICYIHGVYADEISRLNPNLILRCYALKNADVILSLSESDAQFWRTVNKCVRVIKNPIAFEIKDCEVTPVLQSKTILWAGRIAEMKQPLDMLRAFIMVQKAVPDAKLIMLGSGSDAWEEKVQKELIDNELTECVLRVPWSNDVADYYEQARLFCMTSAMREGYPLSLAESKVFGLPCVMYDLSYLTLVEENRGIVTVPYNDIRALSKMLIEVLTNDDYCLELSKEARLSAEANEHYDFKNVWKEIFDLCSVNAFQKPARLDATCEVFLESYLCASSLWIEERRNLQRAHKEIESYTTNIEDLKIKNAKLKSKNETLKARYEEVLSQNKKIKNSKTYKFSRFLSWLPRKIKSFPGKH